MIKYYLEISSADNLDTIVEPLNAKTDLGARRLAKKVMKAYGVQPHDVNLMFYRSTDDCQGRLCLDERKWG